MTSIGNLVRFGIVGSQFEADIHAASIQMGCHGEVAAVASPTPGHPEELAERYEIPKVFHDYHQIVDDPDIDAITIAAPDKLHAQITVDAAAAGKHVVCEKPLCMTLEEADTMVDACQAANVHLLYAEELFFTPKYVKAKEMADQGAFGEIFLVKQSEMHFGPHTEWFWDVDRSGGGVFMDMGCHGMAFAYWFLGRPRPTRITAHMGGDQGCTYGNLHMGNALPTFSSPGYGYAVEKAESTQGWSYPVFEELWNYGFPQEMEHFAKVVKGMEEPQATGADGRVVQELLLAGYQSAGVGAAVDLPFRPPGVERTHRPLVRPDHVTSDARGGVAVDLGGASVRAAPASRFTGGRTGVEPVRASVTQDTAVRRR